MQKRFWPMAFYVWLKGSCHVFISPEPGDGFMSLLSRACCGHAKTGTRGQRARCWENSPTAASLGPSWVPGGVDSRVERFQWFEAPRWFGAIWTAGRWGEHYRFHDSKSQKNQKNMISIDEHLHCLHFVGHAGDKSPTTVQDASDVWVVRWFGVATMKVIWKLYGTMVELVCDMLLYEFHEFAHCKMWWCFPKTTGWVWGLQPGPQLQRPPELMVSYSEGAIQTHVRTDACSILFSILFLIFLVPRCAEVWYKIPSSVIKGLGMLPFLKFGEAEAFLWRCRAWITFSWSIVVRW